MTGVIGENVCRLTGLIIPSIVRVEQSEGLIYPVNSKPLWLYLHQGHPTEVDTPTLWSFGSVPWHNMGVILRRLDLEFCSRFPIRSVGQY